MHPAASLISFTTLSGAGFGLLAMLGLGLPRVTGTTAFVFFALAYGLAVGGLISSVFHLKRPERALLAFTQWRSSWLSREAWAATLTLAVMAVYGAGLVFWETRIAAVGLLGAGLSVATVVSTAMIYASLRSIPRWNDWTTPAVFLAYAAAAGCLLAGQVTAAVLALAVLGAVQVVAWVRGDGRFAASGTTMATATGLTHGRVRAFEAPHTGSNYLTREMVFVVGRRHARTLRVIGLCLAVALPVTFIVLPFSHVLAGAAIVAHLAGTAICRWLFYAEAEHVVGLYYGRRRDVAEVEFLHS